ncbi:MAG: aldehyde dehydrogenase family protein [Thermoplasmata archaeon]
MSASSPPRYPLIIDGTESEGAAPARTLLDPATQQPVAVVGQATRQEARHAMEAADRAFHADGWAGEDGARRARALFRLAQLLEESAARFADIESRNQGKTLREATGDVLFAVRTLEYMAGLADKIEGRSIPVPGARFNYTLREPLGATVHIAPWNFPLVLAIRSVAPALAAGNSVVIKPASLTPLSILEWARLAPRAGIPNGIVNVLPGAGGEVGEALVSDPRCRAVSFTGSVEVGQRIAELAGRQRLPMTLELGGKGPVLVFPDADLDRAARSIGWGIFGNAGQMCWAGSRLLVAASVREPLLERLRLAAEKLKVGPGTAAGVEMGPLVSPEQKERVLGYITEARAGGARAIAGGEPYTDGPLALGNFVPPTILDGLDGGARVLREEVFGPVLAVQEFRTLEEAIALANASSFGLMASVWTRDLLTAHRAAQQLEVGMVTVNEPPLTFPQSPFGGFKASGLGSEQGQAAVEFYTRTKNVLIGLAVPRSKPA